MIERFGTFNCFYFISFQYPFQVFFGTRVSADFALVHSPEQTNLGELANGAPTATLRGGFYIRGAYCIRDVFCT